MGGKEISLEIPGDAFVSLEFFFIAHKHRVRIYSMPVKWVNKDGSTINILKCVLFDPFSLFYIRLMGLLGRYN